MKNNKRVLKYCPNFHKIINFDYSEDDYISHRLVSVYKEYIFVADLSSPENVLKVETLDTTVNRYINDYFFRKEMSASLKEIQVKKQENILLAVVEQIIKIYNRYETDYTRNIYISRWI